MYPETTVHKVNIILFSLHNVYDFWDLISVYFVAVGIEFNIEARKSTRAANN